MTRTKSTYLALIAVLLSPMAANADLITFRLSEVGGDVVGVGSGSIDLAGIVLAGNASISVSRVAGNIGFFFAPAGTYAFYRTAITDIAFGSGGLVTANSSSGDAIGMWAFNDIFYTPVGYVSGTSLANTATWLASTFSSLGLSTGTYDYTVGTNTFRVIIGVPEPGTLALLGIGLVGIGLARRRRKV